MIMTMLLVILSIACITAYTAVVCTKFSDPGLLPVHGFLSMCRNVYGWRSS